MRIEIVKWLELRDAPIIAWSIVRDEIEFLPWFLDHHRRIGIRHFLMVDDGSVDGTVDYLLAQEDCMVVRSEVRYADVVRGKDLLRNAIAQRFFCGRWAFQLDPDEFVFLPSGKGGDLPSLCRALDEAGVVCCWANLVDVYPATFEEVLLPFQPASEPLAVANCFDYGPYLLLNVTPESTTLAPRTVYGGLRERLYRQFGLLSGDQPEATTGLPAPTIYKVPLVKWSPEKELLNSHLLNIRADPRILLALAHVKFAPGLPQRIERALRWRSYWRASIEHRAYAHILESIASSPVPFTWLHPRTRRLSGPLDLQANGLLFAHIQ